MFRRDNKAEARRAALVVAPDRPDQIAERGVIDDLFPAVRGGIETRRGIRRRLVVHARTSAGCFFRAASRRTMSGMSFSALAPAASARPLAPSARTASV